MKIQCYMNVELELVFVLFYELILMRIVRTSENKKAYTKLKIKSF